MNIELGTVVSLKSGGPLMAVEEFGGHCDARCSWFVDQAVQREWFVLIASKQQNLSKSGLSFGAKKVIK